MTSQLIPCTVLPPLLLLILLFSSALPLDAVGPSFKSTSPHVTPITRALASHSNGRGGRLDIARNVGPTLPLPRTTPHTYLGAISTAGSSASARDIPPSVFRTARSSGSSISLHFEVPAGTYDVDIGFVEVTECRTAARVFNVLINGNLRLEAFDIYTQTGRSCQTAFVATFADQIVDPVIDAGITITLRAVAGDAIISYARVRSASSPCIPIARLPALSGGGPDHYAHAVPGQYPPHAGSSRGGGGNGAPMYVDIRNNGFVSVNIDGSGSHTHFSHVGGAGRIIRYRWTLPESGRLISSRPAFTRDFTLGTTRLKLSVLDDACSSHEAETTITVSGSMQPGPYCYVYSPMEGTLPAQSLSLTPRPQFGAAFPSSASIDFTQLPRSIRNSRFTMRCVFNVQFNRAERGTRVAALTSGTGIGRVYEGADLVHDTTSRTAFGQIETSAGMRAFELIYQRRSVSRPPRLRFHINGHPPTAVFHDQSTVLPIVTAISPSSGAIAGGTTVKIAGYGLYQPLRVSFGSRVVTAVQSGSTSREIIVKSPSMPSVQTKQVHVSSIERTRSNAVSYTFSNDCDDVAFEDRELTTGRNGRGVDDLNQPTSVATAADGRLYVGTRAGVVQVISYNSATLRTTRMCHSEVITDSGVRRENGRFSARAVLGITFDPRDNVLRPYISMSTLYWYKYQTVDRSDDRAWMNGAIERLRPATVATRSRDSNQCLQYDRNIVRNLPVSDGDHAINEMLFTQNGDLLIGVGGNTNMGLPHPLLGGRWGAYFSGSVVIARLSRGARFNGVIPYTNPSNARTARPRAGYTDVELFATGMRNLFSLTMTRRGQILGLDMGPNRDFGNAASSCTEYRESDAALRNQLANASFGGGARFCTRGTNGCLSSQSKPDKLLEIKEGQFYGHPNLPRASMRNTPGECVYVDPSTGRSAQPREARPPVNYEAPLATAQSPKTGVREYGANLFCGKLRNDLVLAKIKAHGTWRVKMTPNGRVDGLPFKFHDVGGLRVEENVHGDLFFFKYTNEPRGGVHVMRPRISARDALTVVNALPFRHGRRGGTQLRVGGWGFSNGVRVTVGGRTCVVREKTATEIVCTVPGNRRAGAAADVVVSSGGEHSVLEKAVLYMNV